MKKITTWYKCEGSGCNRETDNGYDIRRQGKKIMLCRECYKKIGMKK
jgi:ribosome-binding protein aMBF1 (putative translation factor)